MDPSDMLALPYLAIIWVLYINNSAPIIIAASQVLLIIITWLSGNLEQRHGGVTRNFAGTLFAIRYRNCLVWRHRVFQFNRNSG